MSVDIPPVTNVKKETDMTMGIISDVINLRKGDFPHRRLPTCASSVTVLGITCVTAVNLMR
jgi:hypothetical protein